MPPRRSQLIVVSKDPKLLMDCRAAAEGSAHVEAPQAVASPLALPPVVNISDWIVFDLDSLESPLEQWSSHLKPPAGQIVVTGTDRAKLARVPGGLSQGRFIPKSLIKNDLHRLIVAGAPGDRFASPPRPSEGPRQEATDTTQHDLHTARRLADLAVRLATQDRERIIRACLEVLPDWAGARRVSLYELDENEAFLNLAGKTHPHPIDERIDLSQAERQPMVRALRFRRSVNAMHWQEVTSVLGQDTVRPRADAYRTECCLIAPMTTGKILVGAINLSDPVRGEGFDPTFVAMCEQVWPLVGAALNNARVFRDVQRQARTDGLTGLANQRTFMVQLKREILRAKRYGTDLSLAMIDMDGLKRVNDTYGHVAGNAVIQCAAARIQATIREIDLPARCGGDEFSVILPNTTLTQAQHVADRLNAAMAEHPCLWQEKEIVVTLSIGLCQYEGQPTASEFIEAADAALYAAKSRGKNCVTLARD